MCLAVRLYNVVEIVVTFGEVACCSVRHSGRCVDDYIMCSELLLMSEIG